MMTTPPPSGPPVVPVVPLGSRGEASLVVGNEHTATSVGSGAIAVLATPVMVNLMEAAALAAAERFLAPGTQSLGTQLTVSHIAATPVGMKATASAEVVAADARTLTFKLEAFDEREIIGEGTHVRVVVNAARYAARVAAKSQ